MKRSLKIIWLGVVTVVCKNARVLAKLGLLFFFYRRFICDITIKNCLFWNLSNENDRKRASIDVIFRIRTENTLLYGKEMVNDENIFRNSWCDLSITHFTYDSRIDCRDPYRRVRNSNTILGLVDSGFDIAAYSYCKTNQKLSIAKMRVQIGLLFLFSRYLQTTLWERRWGTWKIKEELLD